MHITKYEIAYIFSIITQWVVCRAIKATFLLLWLVFHKARTFQALPRNLSIYKMATFLQTKFSCASNYMKNSIRLFILVKLAVVIDYGSESWTKEHQNMNRTIVDLLYWYYYASFTPLVLGRLIDHGTTHTSDSSIYIHYSKLVI